jgi:hypothetical protein
MTRSGPLQQSLFSAAAPAFDAGFRSLERIALDPEAWVDFAPGWVEGPDALFKEIIDSRAWKQRTRWMYQRRVREPRLTAPWSLRSGAPLEPAVLEEMRRCLSARHGVTFDSVGFNLYR